MKVRMGFVSNSSSSSFVVFGYKIKEPKELKDKIDFMRKFNKKALNGIKIDGAEDSEDDILDRFYNLEYLGDKVGWIYDSESEIFYLGHIVSEIYSDDTEIEDVEVDLDELTKKALLVKKILGLTEKPKLYCGSRSC